MSRRVTNLSISARSFLKWAGGKSSLVKTFDKEGLLPRHFTDYYEPFLGGGAVFFYLYDNKYLQNNASLTDINKELIDTYNEIKLRPEQIIEELRSLSKNISKERYYQLRKEFNDLKGNNSLTSKECIRKSALMITLNKTCFNGLYRENKKGEFNVPYGRYKRPRILDEDNINAVSAALANTSIENNDFTHCLRSASEGDFVYFDPPYMPISETSNFTSYSNGGFSFEDQKRLSEVVSKLTERKVLVLLSNSYHDEVKKLYEGIDGIYLNTVQARRSINRDGAGRKPVLEYAITNYSPIPIQEPPEISQESYSCTLLDFHPPTFS
ncbi:MAG: DNA adenine methylase [Euryarchaeota archaeon]|nr:DNA adenine methylase [Euryarchaeota archaeon]